MPTARKCLLLLIAVLWATTLASQERQPIPSDRDALLKGLGMALATYAEVNGYPGPKHVIELQSELGLTRDQLKKAEALANSVKVSATAKGEEIVQEEEELFKLFESGSIHERMLRTKLERIGKLRADLRFIHLQAHLRMKQILTPDQIKRYSELRGHESKRENSAAPAHH